MKSEMQNPYFMRQCADMGLHNVTPRIILEANQMTKEKKGESYQDRSARLFGSTGGRSSSDQIELPPQHRIGAGGGRQKNEARPSSTPLAVGTILHTATDVVHGLLNLRQITDPDRWLKRHGAPVALDTGGMKRYLAADILRWAAAKFGTCESSNRAMCSLAETLESNPAKGGSTTP
jgi:hypothetical protein